VDGFEGVSNRNLVGRMAVAADLNVAGEPPGKIIAKSIAVRLNGPYPHAGISLVSAQMLVHVQTSPDASNGLLPCSHPGIPKRPNLVQLNHLAGQIAEILTLEVRTSLSACSSSLVIVPWRLR